MGLDRDDALLYDPWLQTARAWSTTGDWTKPQHADVSINVDIWLAWTGRRVQGREVGIENSQTTNMEDGHFWCQQYREVRQGCFAGEMMADDLGARRWADSTVHRSHAVLSPTV